MTTTQAATPTRTRDQLRPCAWTNRSTVEEVGGLEHPGTGLDPGENGRPQAPSPAPVGAPGRGDAEPGRTAPASPPRWRGRTMKAAITAGCLLGVAVLLVGGGVAAAQTTPPAPPGGGGTAAQLSEQDRAFMMENAQTNLAEISTGQLAIQRASSPSTKQTAQTVVSDHQQALAQLRDIAQRHSVTLPDSPNPTQQQLARQLQSLTGLAFDRTLLPAWIGGHQQAIAQAQQEIASGTNVDVQQYARGFLPVAQKHLQMAQSDLQQLGGAAPGGVNAGTGGAAAPWASRGLLGGLLGGGSLLVAAALLLLRRRRA
jgi:putative membrane protein